MKNFLKYFSSYACMLLSIPFYAFVGFPNNTDHDTMGLFGFSATTKNVCLYEILPLLIAVLLSLTGYFIYFVILPKQKDKIFSIPEIVIVVCNIALAAINLVMWIGSYWFGNTILIVFSFIILVISVITLFRHKKTESVKE